MAGHSIKKISLGIVGVLVLIAAINWLLPSAKKSEVASPAVHDRSSPPVSVDTVSRRWQWDAVQQEQTRTKTDNQGSKDVYQYDVVAIHEALSMVKLDQSGAIIVDESTLPALQDAFRKLGKEFTPEALVELQALVKIGLPGVAGEQVADILGDYYQYLQAEATLLQQEKIKQKNVATESVSTSLANSQTTLEKLAGLRRDVLGRELALQLYGAEEAQQRYLLRMQAIKSNQDLTEQQRNQALAQLKKDLDHGVLFVDQFDEANLQALRAADEDWQQLGLSNEIQAYLRDQTIGLVAAKALATSAAEQQDWTSRYEQFERERSAIVRAGLSEQDKREQIEWLLDNYFSEQEIAASQNYLPRR